MDNLKNVKKKQTLSLVAAAAIHDLNKPKLVMSSSGPGKSVSMFNKYTARR